MKKRNIVNIEKSSAKNRLLDDKTSMLAIRELLSHYSHGKTNKNFIKYEQYFKKEETIMTKDVLESVCTGNKEKTFLNKSYISYFQNKEK